MPQPVKKTFAQKKAEAAAKAASVAAEQLQAIRRQDRLCIGELNQFANELKARKKAEESAKAKKSKERMSTIEEEHNDEYELYQEWLRNSM